jgi:serine protease Do
MKRFLILSSIALSLGAATAVQSAQSKLTRDQMVHKDKSDVQRIDEWIYNDLEQARAEARRTGKPLMVVFRCIP